MFTNSGGRPNMVMMMALGKMMTRNSFVDEIDEIKELVDVLHDDDRRKTFILHMGENLKKDQVAINDGGATFSVGDDSGRYVQIINHGTCLSGVVSVYFDVIVREKEDIPTAMIVLSVYPLESDDQPPLGLLWMDDLVHSLGPEAGASLSWSVNKLQVPAPGQLGVYSNTFNGFSLGVVTHHPDYYSAQVLSDLLDLNLQPPKFLTPMGIGRKRLEDKYLIYHPGSLKKPEEMSSVQFSILETLFTSGICSFNEKHVRDIYLGIPKFNIDDVNGILRVLIKMATEGWFHTLIYGGSTYYAPTIKTMTSIFS
jgi:hypothetical protein